MDKIERDARDQHLSNIQILESYNAKLTPKKPSKMPFGSKSEMVGTSTSNSLMDKVLKNKPKTTAEDAKPRKHRIRRNMKVIKRIAFNQDKSQFAIIWRNEVSEEEQERKEEKNKKNGNRLDLNILPLSKSVSADAIKEEEVEAPE